MGINLKSIDFGKLISGALMVKGFVETVQREMKGAKGADKKAEVVQRAAKELLPMVESVTGKDLLPDTEYNALLSELIDAEKTAMTANAQVQELRVKLAVFLAATRDLHGKTSEE